MIGSEAWLSTLRETYSPPALVTALSRYGTLLMQVALIHLLNMDNQFGRSTSTILVTFYSLVVWIIQSNCGT